MHRILITLTIAISFLLSACQNNAQIVTLTPPVVSVVEPTAMDEPAAPTAAANTPTPNPSPETTSPSSEPTAAVAESPSSTPTQTPIPAAAVASLSLAPVLEGAFNRPVYLTHAFDDRLFIVEQAGQVRIVRDGRLQDQPFIDISGQVGSTQLEQGLLSIAFHPNYPEDDRFFVYYTDRQGDTHLSSFQVAADNPDLADPGSEIILLTVEQPYPNHNGGQLQFGPDGFLYAGFGDGGSANDPQNNGQNPGTLLGAMLRLDVDSSQGIYAIPSTNPFVSDETRRNEIWAWGLRNPWRFSFDRSTGDLFIADVGQNIWEEVHFQANDSTGGENYGWNILEGSHCFRAEGCDKNGLELPIFEYNHECHCSITGGYMYRGSEYLALYGNYFVADYCSGTIWGLFPENDGSWSATTLLDTQYVVSSFGEDANGELYLLDHTQGSIYRLHP
jgi:glucose/arabinose dehydrogenase